MQLWLKFVLPGLNMFFNLFHTYMMQEKQNWRKKTDSKKKILVKLVVVIEAASFLFYTCLLLF